MNDHQYLEQCDRKREARQRQREQAVRALDSIAPARQSAPAPDRRWAESVLAENARVMSPEFQQQRKDRLAKLERQRQAQAAADAAHRRWQAGQQQQATTQRQRQARAGNCNTVLQFEPVDPRLVDLPADVRATYLANANRVTVLGKPKGSIACPRPK